MTSIIKLTALSGADADSPPCYMLQVDEFRFLLDCGLGLDLSLDLHKELKKHVHQIDAVLISHPDVFHMGSLPHLVGKCGLSCPIYATVPVYEMGQMFVYDFYQSYKSCSDFDLFTLDDVDSCFDKMTRLKFSQSMNLKGKGHGLQITPLPAGHMIGGAIWKIVKDGEEVMVYAVDYNHTRERHLNGGSFDAVQRPHLLITDARNALYTQPRRRLRDEQLMTNILQTVRGGGDVLVAVDTAGRVLELSHLLNQMWGSPDSGLSAYSLAFLNYVTYNVVEFAKTQVEWMSDKLMRGFEQDRNNPFLLRHVSICHSLDDLKQLASPKVVLASMPDLECGFSRELLLSWCGNEKNSVILTTRPPSTSLAARLSKKPPNRGPKQEPFVLDVQVSRRVALEGEELAEHLEREKLRLAEEQQKKDTVLEDESSDESDAEDMVDVSGTLSVTPGGKPDAPPKAPKFFRQASRKHPMYPFVEHHIKWDDYGEIIRPEDFEIKDVVGQTEDAKTKMEVDDTTVKAEAEAEKAAAVKREVPTKCVRETRRLDVRCNVQSIDFEGKSDGESVKKILAQIKPRQMVLVGGGREARAALEEHCRRSEVVSGTIYTPDLGDTVDATTERNIFQVRLKDSLVSAITFVKARDMEIVWLDAEMKMVGSGDREAQEDVQQYMDTDQPSRDLIPILQPLKSQLGSRQSMFFNELKLSDLKGKLIQAGIQAEFSAGALICEGAIAVKKNEAGKVLLEGPISEEYFKVRKLLFDQYAIV